MRSHAKASTAGSNQRQAKGLGRIFRGADAGRGASPDPKGSGASSGRRAPLLVLAIAAAIAAVCLGAGLASAASTNFEFLGAFGPDGTSASGFSQAGSVAVDQEEEAVYVLDGSANALFKFDFEGNPVAFGGSNPDVSGNELSGLSIGGGLGQRQVAVNPNTHVIYLTGGNDVTGRATALQAFEANGEPALFTAGPGEGTNEIGGLPGICGVAVDTSGNIYVSGTKEGVFNGDNLSVYSSTGAVLLPDAVSLSGPGNIAVDTNGVLYVLENGAEAKRYTPSEYPPTSTTTYTPSPDKVDPKAALSLAVDPLTNRLYVLEASFGEEVFRVAVFSEEGTQEATFAGPGEAGELKRPYGIAVANVGELGGKGDIAKPFVSHNPEGGLAQVEMFKEHIVVAAPSVELTAASAITGDSATLRAKVNPNNRETSYWFEYGLGDCEISLCAKVPLSPAPIGQGRKGVVVSRPIVGLTAKSTYHYRVVAQNIIGTTEGPDTTFTTQGSGLGFTLGDSRAWEMVSPPNKFNGEVVTDQTAIVQASATGGGLAYPSLGSIFADSQGSRSPLPATVLAKRDAGGSWASVDLTPPHTEATQVSGGSEFKLFTHDLLSAVMNPVDETPLSPQASEQTPYRWSDGDPPSFDPLVNPANVSPGIKFGPNNGPAIGAHPINIEGASADLNHVVISSRNPLFDGAPAGSYFWSGGELEALTERPESEGGEIAAGLLGAGIGSVRNAVSSDGTRVFWAEGQYNFGGIGTTALYLRDTVAKESFRLDVLQGGSGEGLNLPAFNFASADGGVVFFTDSQQLTADASPKGRDLYRCEIGQVEGGLGCADLTDISGQTASPGESAEVFPQASAATDDGTRLFFTARGVLDQAPNQKGDTAVSGQPNLYLWEEGDGLRFVATLSDSDFPVWGGHPNVGFAGYISAATSPSGRFFTFTSEQSLTGLENHNDSDKPTTEAFLYDADTEDLTCVSCNPAGAGPVGELLAGGVNFAPDPKVLWKNRWVAATLPEASETGDERSLYHPRTVLDDGRVFFNSPDPLVPADSNGNWDVYQWQPLGVGSCSQGTSAAATTRSGAGCVGLISSGTSEGDAGFLDTTPSGNDVFFVTRGRLSALDFDDEIDVYDARVNGIAAQLPSHPECQGEACQPPASAPENPTPSSTAFEGQGNVKPNVRKRCPKAKRRVSRAGRVRCVQRKSHQKKANSNRRAGR